MLIEQASYLLGVYLKSQGAKPGTLRHYGHTLKTFREFCFDRGAQQVEQVDHRLVREYWVYLDEQGYALSGYARDLRRLFTFLCGEGLVSSNPVTKAGIPKAKDKPIKPLPGSVLERLLDAAGKGRNPHRDRLLILLLLDTGARIGELLSVELEQINLENRSIPIRGKGDRDRSLFFGYRAARALHSYLYRERRAMPDCPYLFLNDQGERLGYGAARLMLERLARRAGIPEHVSVSAHKLRHSFATQFLAAGGSALALQRLLGHSTLEMTKRYVSLSDEQLAREHQKASPVDLLLRKAL